MVREESKSDWVITSRELAAKEISDAKELFMLHGFEGIYLVVRKMQAMGWLEFLMRDLGGNKRKRALGLIDGLGWGEEFRDRKRREIAELAAKLSGRQMAADEPAGEVWSEPSAGADPEAASPGKLADEDAVETGLRTVAVAETSETMKGLAFPDWLPMTRPKWDWNWKYQKHICRKLAMVTSGKLRRLAIFLPPRHGKSEMVTVRYAAWRLLRDPSLRIVIGSYNQKLANKFSRRAKAIYLEALGGRSEPDGAELVKESMDEWETAEGGGVKAVGLGAGVTGFGADLIIIDDPIKGRAEAESKTVRDTAWEWYTDDLLTRLEPKGSVVLIQTRWHEDDLAGRLLRTVQGPKSDVQGERVKNDKWEVVSLPALAEENDPLKRKPGEALCNKRFDAKALLKKKAEMGSYSFAALYQQRPAPAEGGMFKREWFSRVVDKAPEGLRWCRGYDLAASIKTSADYTASFRCAIDSEGNLYIADGFRKRIEFPEQRRYIAERLKEERLTEHCVELASNGHALLQEIRRDTGNCGRPVRGVRAVADKYTRALAWANRAEEGKVVLVRGAWIGEFLEEVCRFPTGTHDDQVDAVSLSVQMIGERKKYSYGF